VLGDDGADRVLRLCQFDLSVDERATAEAGGRDGLLLQGVEDCEEPGARFLARAVDAVVEHELPADLLSVEIGEEGFGIHSVHGVPRFRGEMRAPAVSCSRRDQARLVRDAAPCPALSVGRRKATVGLWDAPHCLTRRSSSCSLPAAC
jgi:hypothetical protein